MEETDQLLETLQADILAVLRNSPSLPGANIFADDDGSLESRVMTALGTRASSGSGRGLAVIILPLEVTTAERNLPGPPIMIRCRILTIENVMINRGAGGTGVKSSQAALNVLGAIHHCGVGSHAFYADKDPIVPVKDAPGFVSHTITVYARANGVTGPGKPAAVAADWLTGKLFLTCETVGAAIYFSTDGTYPTPTTATEYTAPIEGLQVGDVIRAAAFVAGQNPGDCTNVGIK